MSRPDDSPGADVAAELEMPVTSRETPTPDAVPEATGQAFARNVLGTALGYLATPIVGIACAPVLVHALGVDGRGEFAATTSPTLLLTLAGTLGLPEAVTYYVASRQMATRAALWRASIQSLVFGVVLAGLVAALASPLSGGDDRVATIMTWGATTLPLALVVGVVRGAAAGRQRWGLVNAERMFGNVLRLALVVAFAVVGRLGLWESTLIYLICPVLAGAVYTRFLAGLLRSTAEPRQAFTAEMTLLGFGMRNWAGGLAGVVLSRLDQVLITPLANSHQLGLYAAAVSIAEIPYVISAATRDVLLAADASRSDDQRAVQASRITFLATLLFAGALAITSPLLIRIAYGSAFADATPMLVLLLLASVAYTPGLTAGGLLLARGRPLARSLSLAGACVLNVALLPVLVPAFGGIGAALASVAAYVLFSTINLTLLTRRSSFGPIEMIVPRREDFRWAIEHIRALRRKRAAGLPS